MDKELIFNHSQELLKHKKMSKENFKVIIDLKELKYSACIEGHAFTLVSEEVDSHDLATALLLNKEGNMSSQSFTSIFSKVIEKWEQNYPKNFYETSVFKSRDMFGISAHRKNNSGVTQKTNFTFENNKPFYKGDIDIIYNNVKLYCEIQIGTYVFEGGDLYFRNIDLRPYIEYRVSKYKNEKNQYTGSASLDDDFLSRLILFISNKMEKRYYNTDNYLKYMDEKIFKEAIEELNIKNIILKSIKDDVKDENCIRRHEKTFNTYISKDEISYSYDYEENTLLVKHNSRQLFSKKTSYDGILKFFTYRINGNKKDLFRDIKVVPNKNIESLTKFFIDLENPKSSGVIHSSMIEYISKICKTLIKTPERVTIIFMHKLGEELIEGKKTFEGITKIKDCYDFLQSSGTYQIVPYNKKF